MGVELRHLRVMDIGGVKKVGISDAKEVVAEIGKLLCTHRDESSTAALLNFTSSHYSST